MSMAIAAIAVASMVIAVVSSLPEQLLRRLYASESSVVEHASIALWGAVAMAIPFLIGRVTCSTIAATIVCLGAAAREADWHKTFTEYSVLKPGFYLRSEFAVLAQGIAGFIVIVILVSALVTAVAVVRLARRDGGCSAAWVRTLLFMLMVLGLGKVLDRLPDLLKHGGISLDAGLGKGILLVEECSELALPVLLFVALIQFSRRRETVVSMSAPFEASEVLPERRSERTTRSQFHRPGR